MNSRMPSTLTPGPTENCSYPLLNELFQPSYQPKSISTHAGNVSTQVLKMACTPSRTFNHSDVKSA